MRERAFRVKAARFSVVSLPATSQACLLWRHGTTRTAPLLALVVKAA